MNTETKQLGILKTWIQDRGFGFVSVRSSASRPDQKYYLHVSRIVVGEASIGAQVRFAVSPVREGTLPSAVEAEIIGIYDGEMA